MKHNYGIFGFLAVAAGVLGAVLIKLPGLYWLMAMMTLSAIGVIGFILNRRSWIAWVVIGGFLCSGGLWLTNTRENYWSDVNFNRRYDNQVVSLRVAVFERPVAGKSGLRFLAKVNPIPGRHVHGKITVFFRGRDMGWYGKNLQITGKFKLARINPMPSLFPDSDERQGSSGIIFLSASPVIIQGNGLPAPYIWANKVRTALMREGVRYLGPENARFLHAMVFGTDLDKSRNDLALQKNLRRTGTIHLLSVSGLHIGFAVAGCTLLLGIFRVPPRFQFGPVVLIIGFYVLMTGMEPPVMRAGIMILLYLCGRFFAIRDSNLNRLGLAALILLLINPYNLFDAGFQLSVLATLGVLWVAPLLWNSLKIRQRYLKPIWEGILLSIGAQLIVTPVIIYYFQQISWSSPLVNLLLAFPAWVAVVGGLVGESCAAVLPWVGQWILYPVNGSLHLIRWITAYCGSWPFAASWSPIWPWPWMVGYYLALILGLDWLQPNLLSGKREKVDGGKIFIGVLIVLNMAVWAVCYAAYQPKFVDVAMIDVGQGDALFLRTPDGKTVLIDGGPPGRGRGRILPFLREKGIERFDLVIITHDHDDHFGGISEVIEEVPAKRVIAAEKTVKRLPLDPRLTSVTTDVHVRDGQALYLSRNVKLTFYTLKKYDLSDENDHSIVTLLEYGKNKLILTGDLTQVGEEILERKHWPSLAANILKVGHHGSNQASGLPFLTQLRPKMAIVSVGAGNRFGHPGKWTMNRFRSLGIPVFRTDLSGTIYLRIYPEKTEICLKR